MEDLLKIAKTTLDNPKGRTIDKHQTGKADFPQDGNIDYPQEETTAFLLMFVKSQRNNGQF